MTFLYVKRFCQTFQARRSPRISPLNWAEEMIRQDTLARPKTPDQTGMTKILFLYFITVVY